MEKFEYAPEVLRKLQITELQMLKEVDRICRKYDIKYIIDAGTLLGAVRHGGFIPWDDDVDIRMLRSEYEKFCAVCKEELSEDFFLQNHETDPGYRWGYARVLKNNTVFLREDHEELKSKNGIFIDIFPSDVLPEKGIGNKLCTCVSWLCRKMLYSELGYRHAPTFLRRLGFAFLNIFPKQWAHNGYNWLASTFRDRNSSLVRCYGWGSREETIGYKKEWLTDIKDIEFEGMLVKAPVKTHEILVHSYGGDYMTPPPKEQRLPKHPASYIKF